MTHRRFTTLLIGALAVILGALYLNSNRNPPPPDARGLLLLPTLAGELDFVTALTVRKGGTAPVVTVHKVARQ